MPRDVRDYEVAVRRQLADSLRYLGEVSGVAASSPDCLDRITGHLLSRQQLPAAFARYLELVETVRSGDGEGAERLFSEIDRLVAEPATFEVVPFAEEELGRDYTFFPRILFSRDYGDQPIVEVAESQFEEVRSHLEAGLDLLSRLAPDLRNEIDALWMRIYVGTLNPDAGGRPFAGVTSFLLWGGTFLNAGAYRTYEEAVEFLVHESTHGLLFALSCEEPLVRNHLQERYPSPLRSDPRPMDGIYHAMLVSGRIACVFEAWLASGGSGDPDLLRKRRDASIEAFEDGARTVSEHGRLNDLGADLFQQSRRAVAAIR